MSICTFIASNAPLPSVVPLHHYPLHINVDLGTVEDGGTDDNYFLHPFLNVRDYTDKEYGVSLEWNYTEGRANQIVDYIKAALKETDVVELWHVWLTDYYEFEDRPYIHRKTISLKSLTAEQIRTTDAAVIWNTPDPIYPERPSFYCLTITR